MGVLRVEHLLASFYLGGFHALVGRVLLGVRASGMDVDR